MWEAIKGLLGSKKALVAVVSALVWVLCKLGLDLDTEQVLPIVAPLWGLIFGIAAQDIGKEKAKILAKAAGLGKTEDKPADPT